MSELAENEGGQEQQTLTQAVTQIFLEAQKTRLIGRERFSLHEDEPKAGPLEAAVGKLATERWMEMIRGDVIGDDPNILDVREELVSWRAESGMRKLHDIAYALYIDQQDEQIRLLLEGKKVIARTIPGSRGNTILHSSGGYPAEAVSGVFMAASVRFQQLFIKDDSTEESDYWMVRMTDVLAHKEPILAADLEIE